jgi:hypothetical protein
MKETVKVYHYPSSVSRDIPFVPQEEIAEYVKSIFNEYTYVADVIISRPMSVGSTLNQSFESTNHIDTNWMLNDEVETYVDRARSTSVGDVFVYQGVSYAVAPYGFINLTTGESL